MASNIILFSCAALLLAAKASAGDFHLGNIDKSQLVYSHFHEKPEEPFLINDEVITVQVTGDSVIKAIRVFDLQGDGTVSVESGNIGEQEVEIKLTGKRGKGYQFVVEVYAQLN